MDTIVKTKSRPHTIGRPAALNKDNEKQICELIVEMLGNGETHQDIAAKIGINISTLSRWRSKHKKIRGAVKTGEQVADNRVVNALFKRATGTATTKETKFFQHEGFVTDQREVIKEVQPDVAAQKHWLKHRASTKDEWKDSQQVEVAHKIDIGVAIQHAISQGEIMEHGSVNQTAIATETPKPPQSDIIDAETDEFSPFAEDKS